MSVLLLADLPPGLVAELPELSIEETLHHLRTATRYPTVDWLEAVVFASRRGPGSRRARYRALLGILVRQLRPHEPRPLDVRYLARASRLGIATVHRILARLRHLGVLNSEAPSAPQWCAVKGGFVADPQRHRLTPWTPQAAAAAGIPEELQVEARLIAWAQREKVWMRRLLSSLRTGNLAPLWRSTIQRRAAQRRAWKAAAAESTASGPATQVATPAPSGQAAALAAVFDALRRGEAPPTPAYVPPTLSSELSGTQERKIPPHGSGSSSENCPTAGQSGNMSTLSHESVASRERDSWCAQAHSAAARVGDQAPAVTVWLLRQLSRETRASLRTVVSTYDRFCKESTELRSVLRKPSAWAFARTRSALFADVSVAA